MKSINLRYILLVITVVALGLWALAVDLPHTFTPGSTISSNEVNENFAALEEAINTFEDAITVANDNNVGIGTTSPNFKLHVVGGLLSVDDNRGIVGTQGQTSCAGTYAVGGCATAGDGVFGRGNRGVFGTSSSGIGVLGVSDARGVVGTQGQTSCAGTYAVGGCATTGDGVFGRSANGRAGFFDGNVQVTGTLTKGGGSFQIDHPLDPTNRYLSHSFVESPDMMNIYNGNAVLDANGEAWVDLPSWFEALNRDFRYQLTALGAPGPNLYIAEQISEDRFKIAGGQPGMEVSWQVTGIRHDPYAELNRIQVEAWKPVAERGTYLHPEAYGKSPEFGVNWGQHLDLAEAINPAETALERER